jgi:hypothetical protein
MAASSMQPNISMSDTTTVRQSLSQDRRFVDVEVHNYDWNQTYTAAAYRKLMLSYSGTQLMAPGDRTALLDDVETFIRERFSGQIIRPLVVTLTTATLGPPGAGGG